MKAFIRKIRPFIIPIIVTLVVVLLFHYIFMFGYVPTSSMEPTLETGSLILGLRLFDELETGDIIIFRHDSSYLVKRIAACEGERKNSRIICAAQRSNAHKERSSELNSPGDLFFCFLVLFQRNVIIVTT